ncbi:MAG: hypothetical protein ACLSG9_07725 [Eubacterium sp.]
MKNWFGKRLQREKSGPTGKNMNQTGQEQTVGKNDQPDIKQRPQR